MISSIIEFIQAVFSTGRSWCPGETMPELWFRGVVNRDHDLLPGAYWRRNCDEDSLVLSFRSMAPALLPHEPLDEWEWYFLMQHYGLPTRLLDWSEDPLAALYFALENPQTVTPAVWVLDPLALNAISSLDLIVVPGHRPWTDHWLTQECRREAAVTKFDRDGRQTDNAKPLAIFPKRHNPRIVAQRGTFTIHGIDEVPINQLAVVKPGVRDVGDVGDAKPDESRLIRIDIDPAARDRMWDELWCLGVNKTALFPEPQSLAEDLKRGYRAC